jgi:Ankyrin repeats (many copies)
LYDFIAGYNNVDVAEFLLENGADVNAQDKGGLIPLHNASSYGVCYTVTWISWHHIAFTSAWFTAEVFIEIDCKILL